MRSAKKFETWPSRLPAICSKQASVSVWITIHLLVFALLLPGRESASNEAHQRGVAFYQTQKLGDAISALAEAAKAEFPGTPEYAESALLIGTSYYLLQQAAKAIPWLEKVTNVNEANYMLGYAYVQTAQQDRSVAAFARLFGLKPDSAGAHLIAGQMMLKEEFEVQAVAEAKRALALEPNIPRAHFLLAEVAIYRGSFAD